MRRRDYRLRFVVVGAFVAVFLFTFLVSNFKAKDETAEAASLANFDAGYIISDYQMGNYSSMTVAEIQNFLRSKNSCNNTNLYQGMARSYEDYTDASGINYNYKIVFSGGAVRYYHVENGHFVCLADETFNGKSAAEVIYEAAMDYRINPQVLIVLLQKEQSLITDSFPNNVQYRSATGYGCPDTAACDAQYYGFRNQVRRAAGLFRTVLDGGWTNYPLGNNYVQYNPDASCGGSTVNIRSLATSALYRYTPYQPNAGAIAAGYGTAYCGAYGNRNFYLYFEDWFGDPTISHVTAKELEESYVVGEGLDGLYKIHSILTGSRLVSAAGGDDGANVYSWEDLDAGTQRWRFEYVAERGTYKITNSKSGKALDVYGARVANGTNIQLWTQNDTCAQEWWVAFEGGSYVLISSCSDMALDIAGASTLNGANLQLWEFNDSNAQRWWFEATEDYLTEMDGTYQIISALGDDKVIDITGGASTAGNGTNIQLWENNGTDAQVWKVTSISEEVYTIQNPKTGRYLDVHDASTSPGANLQLWGGNNSCAQRWKIRLNGEYYTFVSTCAKDLVIDVNNASTALGTNIKMWSFNGSDAQKWKLGKAPKQGIDDGVYYLVSALSEERVMDVANGIGLNGTNVQLGEKNVSSARIWRVINNGNGTYTLQDPSSGKVLDVYGGSVSRGANVQLWESNGTCAQRWTAQQSGKYYSFASACSGLVIDVDDGLTTPGTNIKIWSTNGSSAQKWLLVEAES